MVLKDCEAEARLTAITGRPAYKQVADDLRAKIADGTHPVGGPLPSTSQLMETYDVSITVARAAVKELQVEGLVIGQPGKGVYVQREPAGIGSTDLTKRLDELTETVHRLDERLAAIEKGGRAQRHR